MNWPAQDCPVFQSRDAVPQHITRIVERGPWRRGATPHTFYERREDGWEFMGTRCTGTMLADSCPPPEDFEAEAYVITA